MKKLLLTSLVLLVITVPLKAQIPSNNLECWNAFPGPPAYEEPCGWTSFNSSSSQGYPVFVYKTTDSQTDSFAIEVRTVGYINPYPPFNFITDIGLARTSNNYQNGVTGFPYSQRPSTFSAWVKYLPEGLDSAEIKIKLFRWNPNFNQPDDIGTARFFVTSNDSTYHCVTAPFSYLSPLFPDTACVYISSTQDTVYENIIRVDNISFGNCITPVNEIIHHPSTAFYPNPAADQIMFSSLPAGTDRIKIFEITGKMVAAEAVSGSHLQMDIQMLSPGIYFYAAYDEDNKMVSSGKFSVVR